MARTIEESIMNARAFVGNGQAQVSKPSKPYMAIGNSIPKVGLHYECKRLEINSQGKLTFRSIKTTTVQEVKELASNVFLVETRNFYYVTRVLNRRIENVHFAVVSSEPQIGSSMNCYKMLFENERCILLNWYTTTVQMVNHMHGLYKVKTANSIYVCFPMYAI